MAKEASDAHGFDLPMMFFRLGVLFILLLLLLLWIRVITIITRHRKRSSPHPLAESLCHLIGNVACACRQTKGTARAAAPPSSQPSAASASSGETGEGT